jgi:hypothetical protein
MIVTVTFLTTVTLVINVGTDIIIGLVAKVSKVLTVTNVANVSRYREHFRYITTLQQFTV